MKIFYTLLVIFALWSAPVWSANAGVPDANSVTLREYIDIRLAAKDHAIEVALKALDERLSETASGLDKRLNGMNEFRDTLKDQNSTFVTRTELVAACILVVGLLTFLDKWKSDKRG